MHGDNGQLEIESSEQDDDENGFMTDPRNVCDLEEENIDLKE